MDRKECRKMMKTNKGRRWKMKKNVGWGVCMKAIYCWAWPSTTASGVPKTFRVLQGSQPNFPFQHHVAMWATFEGRPVFQGLRHIERMVSLSVPLSGWLQEQSRGRPKSSLGAPIPALRSAAYMVCTSHSNAGLSSSHRAPYFRANNCGATDTHLAMGQNPG